MRTNLRLLASTIAAMGYAALGGCGSVAPEKLHPVTSGATIELPANLVWDYPSTFVDWQEMLLAGSYQAVAEDDNGTYFLGDRRCFFQTHAQGGSKEGKHVWGRANVCGIYVPRLPGQAPKVFEVLGEVVDKIVLDENGAPVPDLPAETYQTTLDTTHSQVVTGLVMGTAALQRGRYQMVPIQPPAGLLQAAIKVR